MAGLRESYESETLRLVLSFIFYTLVSLGTLFLIGRSFLASGTPGLLLLECGVILWSLAGTVGDAVSHGDANVNVTIFNTGILLAGLCHLAGAILSLRPQRALRATPLWLAAGCALALGALWLVTWAALANWLPVFFIPGQGGTPVRYWVLISAIAMFVLSAGLLLAGQRGARSPFTSWYALALLLLAVGLFGVMIQLSLGSVVNWLGRTAQWLGGVYLLLAAVAALRESQLPLLPLGRRVASGALPLRRGHRDRPCRCGRAIGSLPALGTCSPLSVFYPAVILAALYGGLRAGLLATVLSALIVDYFWMEPLRLFTIGSPTDWLTLLFFLLSCTTVSFIIEAMHRARARLILHQNHLEELVKDRTTELEREVVERKQAEEVRELLLREVDEARRRFEAVVENSPVGICAWRGPDLVYELANSAYHVFAPGKQFLGKTYAETWPEAIEPYISIIRRVMETGEPYYATNAAVRIRRGLDGPLEEGFFNILYSALPSDASGRAGVLNMAIETTEQVRSAEALHHSEQRYRSLHSELEIVSVSEPPSWSARTRSYRSLLCRLPRPG